MHLSGNGKRGQRGQRPDSSRLTRGAKRTICRQEEVSCVALRQPPDFVDLLFDLQALQVVELGLVALEGAVHVVLRSTPGPILALNNKGQNQRALARHPARSQG